MFVIRTNLNGSYIWKYGRSEGRWLVCGSNIDIARKYRSREAAESWLLSIRRSFPNAFVEEI